MSAVRIAGAAGFGAGGEQDGSGAEEHGEERAHLALGEDPAEEPGDGVDAHVGAAEDRVHGGEGDAVVPAGQAEGGDVHGEDAEQGHAAEGVDGGDALLPGDGAGGGVGRAGELFGGAGGERRGVERGDIAGYGGGAHGSGSWSGFLGGCKYGGACLRGSGESVRARVAASKQNRRLELQNGIEAETAGDVGEPGSGVRCAGAGDAALSGS